MLFVIACSQKEVKRSNKVEQKKISKKKRKRAFKRNIMRGASMRAMQNYLLYFIRINYKDYNYEISLRE